MKASGQKSKKLLSVFLSAVMVAQMYSAPIQTAYASSGVASAADVAAAQSPEGGDANDNAVSDGEATGESTTAGATGEAQNNAAAGASAEFGSVENGEIGSEETGSAVNGENNSATTDGEDSSSVKNSAKNDADAKNADGSEESNTGSAAKLSEEAIALASANGELGDSNETYNEGADYKEVGAGISVKIYKDSGYSQEVTDSDSFTTDTTLYGKLNIDFSDSEKPTLSSPNIKYTFPKNVTFTNRAVQPLYDSNNKQAGTWYVQEGIAYLHYNEDWLRTNSNNITAHVSFDFTMAGNSQGDGKSIIVNFPGVATPVTIKTTAPLMPTSTAATRPSLGKAPPLTRRTILILGRSRSLPRLMPPI